MIYILCEPGVEEYGEAIAAVLRTMPPEVESVNEESIAPTSIHAHWDDVLVVPFQSNHLPGWAAEWIAAFREAHAVRGPNGEARPAGFVLPISIGRSDDPTPPDPISGLKALTYHGPEPTHAGQIAARVEVFTGLGLNRGEQEVFISYRSTDGAGLAEDLYERLERAGFRPWLDEAEEELPAGADLRAELEDRVSRAGLLVVLDTPEACSSEWIHHEVDHAIGALVPILPIVVGRPQSNSRFPQLQALPRGAEIQPEGPDGGGLADHEWADISTSIEDKLREIYRRRMRVAHHTERAFASNGFSWAPIDGPRRVYESIRRHGRVSVAVLSQCSVFDPKFESALVAYRDYLAAFPEIARFNFKLFVYGSPEVLSDREFETLRRKIAEIPFVLAHYNELEVLIESNFAALGA